MMELEGCEVVRDWDVVLREVVYGDVVLVGGGSDRRLGPHPPPLPPLAFNGRKQLSIPQSMRAAFTKTPPPPTVW